MIQSAIYLLTEPNTPRVRNTMVDGLAVLWISSAVLSTLILILNVTLITLGLTLVSFVLAMGWWAWSNLCHR